MDVLSLLDLPHCEAQRLLATGVPVYLTVNPVEYHGPHLSLHNDRLVSRGIVRELHARLAVRHPDWPLVMSEDLEVGVEPCPGAGTRMGRFDTTRELVLDACRGLAELGARRVVIMTFHGAPLHSHAIQAGIDWLVEHGVRAVAPFNIVLRDLVDREDFSQFAEGLEPITDAAEREAVARDLRFDFHAGFFETSMSLHYAPASVSPSHRELPPCPAITPEPLFRAAAWAARSLGRTTLAHELEFAAVGYGWHALRPFPGYTGRPHLASARSGAVFARYMIDGLEPVVEAVLEGRAEGPPPIMPWALTVSAGGRLGGIPRMPLSDIGLPATRS